MQWGIVRFGILVYLVKSIKEIVISVYITETHTHIVYIFVNTEIPNRIACIYVQNINRYLYRISAFQHILCIKLSWDSYAFLKYKVV